MMRFLRANLQWLLLFTVLATQACSGAEEVESLPPSQETCAPGEWTDEDGGCQPAGLPPDMPACAPGEKALEDGSCRAAGVPPDGCGPGFSHDGDGGCEPIAPALPCAPGEMVVLGSGECQEVSPCEGGKWGNIPLEDTTVFVDAAAPPGGTGKMESPYPTIQLAVSKAPPGAVVAIAGGTYPEEVVIKKGLRLWGACAGAVEIAAESETVFALEVEASNVEIHQIGVTGPFVGIGVTYADGVLLDRLRVHDTGNTAIQVIGSGGDGTRIQHVLVEGAATTGILAYNSAVQVSETNVRGTLGDPLYLTGGLVVGTDGGDRSVVHVASSVFEANSGVGVAALDASLTVEGSLIRDGTESAGLAVGAVSRTDTKNAPLAELILRRSVLDHNVQTGVSSLSGMLTLESTTVRGGEPDAEGSAFGVIADIVFSGYPSPAISIRESKIDGIQGLGVALGGSTGTIESTIVRNTTADPPHAGLGMLIGASLNGVASDIAVIDSVVAENEETGVYVSGSHAVLDHSAFRDVKPSKDPARSGLATGVFATDDPDTKVRSNVQIRASEVSRMLHTGIAVVGSDLEVEATTIRDTLAPDELSTACGIALTGVGSLATLVLRRSVVEKNQGVGVLADGVTLVVEGSVVTHTKPSPWYGIGVGILASSSTVTVVSSRIDANKGWGLGAVDGDIALSHTAFDDNVPSHGLAGIGLLLVSPDHADVEQCTFRRNTMAGAYVSRGPATFREALFEETAIEPSGDADEAVVTTRGGDGLQVVSAEGERTEVEVDRCTFRGNARAAIANWGGVVTLGSSLLTCNAFDMNGEPYAGYDYEFRTPTRSVCGCDGVAEDCRVASIGVAAPDVGVSPQ